MADPFDYVSVADATRRFAELVGNDKKLTAAVKHTMETLNNE
jgi:PIN domain nuclease of toxin-antitoxin system